jgi:hypothetical protein
MTEPTPGASAAGDDFQRERRFVLQREHAQAFIVAVAPWVALEVYDAERPLAYTRTTYLDSDDLAYFRSCEEPAPVMERLRVREYAAGTAGQEPPVLTGTCYLELKVSRADLRQKLRFAAPPEVIDELVHGDGVTDAGWTERLALNEAFAPIVGRLRAQRLRPRLTTWYHRASLSGEEGRVRLTLDEGIAFCRPTEVGAAGARAEPDEVLAYGPGRILEVKLRGDAPGWLAEALEPLLEDKRFSKFRTGMQVVQQAGALPDRRSTNFLAVPERLRVKTG